MLQIWKLQCITDLVELQAEYSLQFLSIHTW